MTNLDELLQKGFEIDKYNDIIILKKDISMTGDIYCFYDTKLNKEIGKYQKIDGVYYLR